MTSGEGVVDVHADGVAAEAPPIGEPVGLDDDVAEVDVAEDSHDAKAESLGEEFD